MTVSTEISREIKNGNGSTTSFAFSFPYIDAAEIVVVLVSSAGVETTQTLTTHYTLTGGGGVAGSVEMVTAPASGEKLIIYRDRSYTQDDDFVTQDPLPAETIEQSLDKAVYMIQQVKDLAERSIKFPVSEALATVSILDNATTRANTLLGFDANGDITLSADAATSAAAAAASAAAAAASAASLNLPVLSGGDAGKLLVVNSTEDGYELAANAGLPAIGGGDALKSVTVNAGATAYELVRHVTEAKVVGTPRTVSAAFTAEQGYFQSEVTWSGFVSWVPKPFTHAQLTGNVTLSLSGTGLKPGVTYTLILRQDATGSRTITWPSGFRWAGGGSGPALSTAANAVDMVQVVGVEYPSTFTTGFAVIGKAFD